MISNPDSGDPLPYTWVLASSFASTSFFYVLSAISLVALLLLSALVSGSEAAFAALTPTERHVLQRNRRMGNRLLRLLEKPKYLLATIQIANAFINVSIAVVGILLVWQWQPAGIVPGLPTLAVVLFIAFGIVFFGEVLPKVYAQKHKRAFIRWATYPLLVTNVVFRPFVWLLVQVTQYIEQYVHRKGYKISVDELNQVLELSTGTGTTPTEREILRGIVNFGTVSARQVMTPRVDISAVPTALDFHELMDKINKTGYSRIPVYSESIDQVEGILYIKDLLPYLEETENFDWHAFIRPPYFIPENKKINDLLRDFQARRVHIALVVDEYGGTSGLVTLEDIIEEIVGEIHDEFDEARKGFTQLDERTFIFEGKTSLNDFCRMMEVDADALDEVRGDSESLGGLLLELFARLPVAGEKISYGQFTFTPISVDNKKIKRVKVVLSKQEEKTDGTESVSRKTRTAS